MPVAPNTEQPRRTRRRVGVPLLVLAAAACTAAVAAQAASASAPSHVSARPHQATSITATSTSSGKNDQAEEFTACMRAHGVSDFPGISISSDGQIHRKGGSVNPISTAYKAAAKTCASRLPTGSALPTDPQLPTPTAPAFTFTCEGDCPTPPKVPALPN
ncbi:MAG: hypothetical protein JWN52_5813 [Actinomycetia bacterium]|nr:hypothetical protein [Actinomycetes bacterium]